METEKHCEKATGWYTAARVVAFIATHTIYPATYHNCDTINEEDAPYILLCNHDSMLDPLAIARPIKRYEVRYLGKKELAEKKLFKFVMEKLHMIPVDRHHSDMAAMRSCMKALREKHVLGIFPEGTRHHKEMMETIETGTAVIAMHSKVPLMPVYIHGKFRPFHRTHIYYGTPMQVDDLYESGDTAAFIERIRAQFYQMRAEAEKNLKK